MWIYQGKEFTSADIPEGAEGFVYIVTDDEGKKYIGQKRFYSKRKLPPLKGKTRKRTKIVESDWLTYFGSSANVAARLAQEGADAFTREILHICFSKGELHYIETKEIILRDALLRDDYYNGIIQCRINRAHLKNMVA